MCFWCNCLAFLLKRLFLSCSSGPNTKFRRCVTVSFNGGSYFSAPMRKEILTLFIVASLATLYVFFSPGSSNGFSPEFKLELFIDEDRQHTIESIHECQFEEQEDGAAHLGFFRGNVWTRITITNAGRPKSDYVVFLQNLFGVGYTFFDNQNGSYIPRNNRYKFNDSRTFNDRNPNFLVSLDADETKVFYLKNESDGRTTDLSTSVFEKEAYFSIIRDSERFHDIFIGVFVLIILGVSIYFSVSRLQLAFYFLMLVLGRFITQLGLNGTLHGMIADNHLVDHIVFFFLKLWIIFSLLFCARITELHLVRPKFWRFIKGFIYLSLGLYAYQFIWYNSSIQYLHQIENLLTFSAFILVVLMLILTYKNSSQVVRLYFLAYCSFILFGLVILITSWGNRWDIKFDKFFLLESGAMIEYLILCYALVQEVIRRQKNFQEVTSKLGELSESKVDRATSPQQSEGVISILKSIETGMRTEEDWNSFIGSYSKINSNFLNTLLTDYPHLSKSDIRICLLFRLKFSYKEIAHLLNITPDTVKKYRYRIRRKLDLPKDLTIDQFLDKI